MDAALEAVGSVAQATDRAAFDLTVDGAPRGDRVTPDGAVTVLWGVARRPALLELQSELLASLGPFVESDGDAHAFVRTEDEPDISQSTIDYVEQFVAHHSGPNYAPHITLGRTTAEDVASLTDESATPIQFTSPALAVYQLGDHGTARRLLARWIR